MNHNTLRQWMQLHRLRKCFIVLFILFFLFCEGWDNLHIVLPPNDNKPTIQSAAYGVVQSLVGNLWQVGMAFSIAEHWTMYSFANPWDQQLLILGVDRNGRGVILPIPSQSPRNFLQSNLIDYHENKMLEGSWKWAPLREMLASSMCRLYAKKYDLKSILFVQITRRILPWEEAVKVHRYYDMHTNELKYGEYPCRD